MATNRHDTLDPALLRPGRLDRKIEFPLPDRRQKRLIFSTITSKMNLSEEVDLEDYVARYSNDSSVTYHYSSVPVSLSGHHTVRPSYPDTFYSYEGPSVRITRHDCSFCYPDASG